MRFGRTICTVVLISLGVFPSVNNALAQSTNGSDRTLRTADGWTIHVTYYERTGDKESPAVILLPAAEGPEDKASRTRKAWNGIAEILHRKGFAVVTADLRKHGDSVSELDNPRLKKMGTADYQLMAAQDLEAIKSFLLEEHQNEKLNIRKLGIAASGSSCMVASAFAANDWMKKPWPDNSSFALRTPKGQDVRALLMFSPKSPVKGINTNLVMKAVGDANKGIAINLFYNPSQRTEKKAADAISRLIKIRNNTDEDARKVEKGPPGVKYSGEGMLQLEGEAQKTMESFVVEFFEKYVKDRQDPWRTRTSRLQQ